MQRIWYRMILQNGDIAKKSKITASKVNVKPLMTVES